MAELVGRAQEPDGTEVSGDFLSLLSLISLRSHDDVSVLRPTAAIAGDVARALGHGASDEQADSGATSAAKIKRKGRDIFSSVAAEFDLDLGGAFGSKARGAPQSAVPLEAVERSLETLHEHSHAVERYHYATDNSRTEALWRAASSPLVSTLDEVLREIDYLGLPTLESPMWESQLEVAFLTVLVLRMRSELDEDSVSDVLCRVFGVTETDGMTNHLPEALDALRNGGLAARGAAGQRKYELDENWASIGISRLREEIRAVVPALATQPQQAAQQEDLPRAEDVQPLNDGQAASKLRYIPHDDIYQAVLRIISDAPSTMSQRTVNDLAQSSLGIPDSEAHYVKPGTDRTQFSHLVWAHGLRKLRDEGKIAQVPGGFKRATTLSAGESVPAGERSGDGEVDEETNAVGTAYREYAVATHELVDVEGRESTAVADAGFDLVGWRQPTMTTGRTVDAFAYRIVEDAASLHDGLADQIRNGLAAIQAYLRAKPGFEGVGVGVSGHVLVWQALPEEVRQAVHSAWNGNIKGKMPVGLHLVPMPDLDGMATAIVDVLGEAGGKGMPDSALFPKARTAAGKPISRRVYRDAHERLSRLGAIEPIGDNGWRLARGQAEKPADGEQGGGSPESTGNAAVDSSADVGADTPKVRAAEAEALKRSSGQAASVADAADGDRSKRLNRTGHSAFAGRYREYATTTHELVEVEGRESTAVADAGFDLVGWRQPTKTTGGTVSAFAYRIVEDAASLHDGLADQIRSGVAAIQAYLRAKPGFEGVGVSVSGHVLVREPFTENARKAMQAAWNPSGKSPVRIHVVPLDHPPADVAGATAPPQDDSPAGEPESLGGPTTAGDEGSTVLIDPFVPRVTPLLLDILKDAEQPLTAREIEQRVRAELDRDSTGAAVATEPDDITRARGGLANVALIEFHGGRWTVTEAGRQSVALEESVAKEAMAEEDWAEFRLAVGGDKTQAVKLMQEIHDAFKGEDGTAFERLCRILVAMSPNVVTAALVDLSADHACDVIGYDKDGDEVCFVQCKHYRDDGERTPSKYVTKLTDVRYAFGTIYDHYVQDQGHGKRMEVIWATTGRILNEALDHARDRTTTSHNQGVDVQYTVWGPADIYSRLLNASDLVERVRRQDESGKLLEFARVNRVALRNFRTDKA